MSMATVGPLDGVTDRTITSPFGNMALQRGWRSGHFCVCPFVKAAGRQVRTEDALL